jgi:hypothetical protein
VTPVETHPCLRVVTVIYGGLSLLSFLTRNSPGYTDNPLRHDLWRAGHAHAGVYLVLSQVRPSLLGSLGYMRHSNCTLPAPCQLVGIPVAVALAEQHQAA